MGEKKEEWGCEKKGSSDGSTPVRAVCFKKIVDTDDSSKGVITDYIEFEKNPHTGDLIDINRIQASDNETGNNLVHMAKHWTSIRKKKPITDN